MADKVENITLGASIDVTQAKKDIVQLSNELVKMTKDTVKAISDMDNVPKYLTTAVNKLVTPLKQVQTALDKINKTSYEVNTDAYDEAVARAKKLEVEISNLTKNLANAKETLSKGWVFDKSAWNPLYEEIEQKKMALDQDQRVTEKYIDDLQRNLDKYTSYIAEIDNKIKGASKAGSQGFATFWATDLEYSAERIEEYFKTLDKIEKTRATLRSEKLEAEQLSSELQKVNQQLSATDKYEKSFIPQETLAELAKAVETGEQTLAKYNSDLAETDRQIKNLVASGSDLERVFVSDTDETNLTARYNNLKALLSATQNLMPKAEPTFYQDDLYNATKATQDATQANNEYHASFQQLRDAYNEMNAQIERYVQMWTPIVSKDVMPHLRENAIEYYELGDAMEQVGAQLEAMGVNLESFNNVSTALSVIKNECTELVAVGDITPLTNQAEKLGYTFDLDAEKIDAFKKSATETTSELSKSLQGFGEERFGELFDEKAEELYNLNNQITELKQNMFLFREANQVGETPMLDSMSIELDKLQGQYEKLLTELQEIANVIGEVNSEGAILSRGEVMANTPVEEYRKPMISAEDLASANSLRDIYKENAKQYYYMTQDLYNIKKNYDTLSKSNPQGSEMLDAMEKQIDELEKELSQLLGETQQLGKSVGAPIDIGGIYDIGRRLSESGDGVDHFKNRMEALSQVNQWAKKAVFSLLGELKKLGGALLECTKRMLGFKKNSVNVNNVLKKGFRFLIKYGLGVRSIFMAYRKLRTAVTESVKVLVKEDSTLNASLSEVTSAFKTLKYTLGGAFAPIINVVSPILTNFANLLIDVTNKVGMLIAALSGASTYQKAKRIQEDYAESLDKTAKSAGNANKQLAAFDKLNVLNSNSGSGSGDDMEDYYEEVEVSADLLDKIKDIFSLEGLYDLGKTFAEKINDFMANIPWDSIKQKASEIGQKLATLINGWVDNLHFDDVGHTIAEGFNTVFNFLYDFVTTLHWREIGEGIGEAITQFFNDTDFNLIADTIAATINGWGNTIAGLLEKTDFALIGDKVGQFLDELFTGEDGIDWDLLADNVRNAIIGMATTVSHILQNVDFEEIGTKVADCLEAIFDPDKQPNVLDTVGDAIWKCINAVLDFNKGLFDGDSTVGFIVDGIVAAIVVAKVLPIINTLCLLLTGSSFTPMLTNAGTSMGGSILGGLAKKLGGTAAVQTLTTALTTDMSLVMKAGTFAEKVTMVGSAIALGLMAAIEGYKLGQWLYNQFLEGTKWDAFGYDYFHDPIEEAKANMKNDMYDMAMNGWDAGLKQVATQLQWNALIDQNYASNAVWSDTIFGISEALSLLNEYNIDIAALHDYMKENEDYNIDEWLIGKGIDDSLVIQYIDELIRNYDKLSTQNKKLVDDLSKSNYAKTVSELFHTASEGVRQNGNDVARYSDEFYSAYDSVMESANELANSTVELTTSTTTNAETQSRALKASSDAYKNYAATAVQSIDTVVQSGGGAMTNAVYDMVGLKDTMLTTMDDIVTTGTQDSKSMTSIFKTLAGNMKTSFNSIISGSESMSNGVTDGINQVAESLNTFSFDIPDWVPGFGGKTLSFNLPRLGKISIPKLAQGAVIPANNEFLAVLGDQKSGTNIEAPLDTIKQAVAEVMLQMGSVLKDDNDIVINIDGDEIFRVIRKQDRIFKKSTGKSAFA